MKTCLLLILFIPFARAQNLIPDSSFEQNNYFPTDFSAINNSAFWNMPTQGTTDLFCACDKKHKKYSMVDVPQNPMGYQPAHSGNCYAGIFAFSHGNYREYLQTPLVSPLEKGKTYMFSMYVTLADYSRTYIDQLGVCFLADKANYKSCNVISDLNPVYIKIHKVGIEDWHKVTVTYKAKGGEKYVLLGSFKVNKTTKTKLKVPKEIKSRINQNSERDAYYFIDDVSLTETTVVVVEPVAPIKTELDTLTKIPLDTLFVLKNVLFQTGKAVLLPSSYEDLDKITDYLNANPTLKIKIAGHSDNVGSESLNQKLSADRAKAVANYLIKNHINKQRITVVGYGSTKPLVLNDTPEHQQLNRRVEFKVLTN
ncbi:MAG TPA: OmpA family protein [Bacteroidia bacterium]|nr:OmpA family protein [Bacteroidia bacterium]